MTLPKKNDGRDGGMEVPVREDERVKRSVRRKMKKEEKEINER